MSVGQGRRLGCGSCWLHVLFYVKREKGEGSQTTGNRGNTFIIRSYARDNWSKYISLYIFMLYSLILQNQNLNFESRVSCSKKNTSWWPKNWPVDYTPWSAVSPSLPSPPLYPPSPLSLQLLILHAERSCEISFNHCMALPWCNDWTVQEPVSQWCMPGMLHAVVQLVSQHLCETTGKATPWNSSIFSTINIESLFIE